MQVHIISKYNNVLLFVMASGEEKWFLQLDYVNMGKPTTIYLAPRSLMRK